MNYWSRSRPLCAVVTSVLLASSLASFAQTASSPATPPFLTNSLEPATRAAAKDISVLILALDGLERPRLILPSPSSALPAMTLPPELPAAQPEEIPQQQSTQEAGDGQNDEPTSSPFVPVRPELPTIVPSSGFESDVFQPQIIVRAYAQKKDKDAEKFKIEPLPAPEYSMPELSSPQQPAIGSPPTTTPSAATGDGTALTAETYQELPGPALMTAAPLRRALVGLGWREGKVLSTSLGGPAILRALNSEMLSNQVLNDLRSSMSHVAAMRTAENVALDPAYIQAATRAASRIGQTLGYQAVVVMVVEPARVPSLLTAADASPAPRSAHCTLLLVDTLRDSGQIMGYQADGVGEAGLYADAAQIGAATLGDKLARWQPATAADRSLQVNRYLHETQVAIERGDLDAARDYGGRVMALEPTRSGVYLMLGEALETVAPAEAAALYSKAVSLNEKDGSLWARIAIALTRGENPDWSGALQNAERALQLRHDSAQLRLAIATAEYGRATLYRSHDRISRAEDYELAAGRHLDRALELAAGDVQLTREAARLKSHHLLEAKRYRDAVQTLDKVAMQFPDDVPIQRLYATALTELGGRDEDAFVAWSRVWKLSNEQEVPLDPQSYTRLSNGFDMRVANLAKNAGQLANGVASSSVDRAQALLLLQRLRREMEVAETAIKTIAPPPGNLGSTAHWQRVFAVDLMTQALETYQVFIESGQNSHRQRASELHRQALNQINAARAARPSR